MIKKALKHNITNEISFIGEWDYGVMVINDEEVITNPIPISHTYGEFDIEYIQSENRWKLVAEATDKDRIRQLEDMILTLLEVI